MLALETETLNMTVIINEGDVGLKSCHLTASVSKPGLCADITDLEDSRFICKAKVPPKPLFSDEELSTD